jgi:hypothetical protein
MASLNLPPKLAWLWRISSCLGWPFNWVFSYSASHRFKCVGHFRKNTEAPRRSVAALCNPPIRYAVGGLVTGLRQRGLGSERRRERARRRSEKLAAQAKRISRSVELIVQPDVHDVVGEMRVRRCGSTQWYYQTETRVSQHAGGPGDGVERCPLYS